MSAPSARTSFPASTRTSRKPTWWCWSAATPPGAIRCCTSGCRRPARRTATKIVVLDPRRTATAEAADLHMPLAPGSDVALFNGLLALSAREPGRIDQDWVARPTPAGSHEALAAGGGTRTGEPRPTVARKCGVDPEVLEAFYDMFADDRTRDDGLLPGGEPVLGRNRQGQRHHQLPSRHRTDRPAGHGPVLGHRPAQRDGRARGRRPGQPACRAYALRRSGRPGRAAGVLAVARAGAEARPEGDGSVRRRAGWPDQGGVDRRHQPRRQHAPSRPGPARRWRPARSWWCRTAGDTDTTDLAQWCCRPPPGARRTAPSPTRSGGISRQRAFRRRRGRRGRTGGSSPRSAGRMGWASFRMARSRPAMFREHAALSGHANDRPAPVRHRRAWRVWTMPATRRCSRSAGRCRPGRSARAAGCSRKAGSPQRTAAPASLPTTLPAARIGGVAAEHRPRSRSVAHDDPHRAGAGADDPYTGAAAFDPPG